MDFVDKYVVRGAAIKERIIDMAFVLPQLLVRPWVPRLLTR
jgi:hypothetical protein